MLFKFLYKDKDNILTETFFWMQLMIEKLKSSAPAHAENIPNSFKLPTSG